MLIVLIGLTGFRLAVASLILGLARRCASLMETRIRTSGRAPSTQSKGNLDLDVPFTDRVLKPSVEALANAATSVLPARVLANIQQQLVMAGNPMRLNTFVDVLDGHASASCPASC